MAKKTKSYNDRVAFVYRAAAFLIIILGGRTIVTPYVKPGSGFYFVILGITIFGLLLEFVALLSYAKAVKVQDKASPSEGETHDAPAAGTSVDLSGIQDVMASLNQNVSQSLKETSATIQNNLASMEKFTAALEAVGNDMNKLINNEIDRRIESTISNLVKKGN